MYRAVTRSIEVTVEPLFLEEESDPEQGHWFWAYTIEITNRGTEIVQLRNRYWRIVNANGHTEEVRGPGVVGEEPVLQEGETFRYTSGCPLDTSSGFMSGRYQMEYGSGERFEVEIPLFPLDVPNGERVLN